MATGQLLLTAGAAPPTPPSGKGAFFENSSKNPAFINDTGQAFDMVLGPVNYQATPSNPATTTSTTGVMAGLLSGAVAFTPNYSGRVLIIISGDVSNGTASDGSKMQIRFGTGNGPANGAALTGTSVGNLVRQLNNANTAAEVTPFTCNAIVTGLTLGTGYYVDLSQASITGGTTTLADISISVIEF